LEDDRTAARLRQGLVPGLGRESMGPVTAQFRPSDYSMQKSSSASPSDKPSASPEAEQLIQRFVEHWGVMARAWGINSSMGELFALLYISGTDWTAEELRHRLGVSRGNVSMNLRELLSWGVVHKVHRAGERRELFRAETDVWTLFRKILTERKRRELDPSLRVLDHAFDLAEEHPDLHDLRNRIEPLRHFFKTIDALAVQLLSLPWSDLAEISHLLGSGMADGGSGVGEPSQEGGEDQAGSEK
jgi:HTH-type transcriptional regulator, glycine betaine synthesis regulator